MLRFALDPSVPATNNLAERLLRLHKIQRKISGCCRSVAGAVAQANLRTMPETARMQGWNVFETLEGRPGGGFDQAEDAVAGRLRLHAPEFRPKDAERPHDGRIST